jgi:hypothetical protein
MNKKIFICAGIGLFITAGFAATQVPPEKPGWKNVKALHYPLKPRKSGIYAIQTFNGPIIKSVIKLLS